MIPALLMNVSPCEVDRHAVALQDHDQFGELRSAVTLTKYAGSREGGPARIGVIAVACRHLGAAGHPAGFWLNACRYTPAAMSSSLDGNCFGKVHLDRSRCSPGCRAALWGRRASR